MKRWRRLRNSRLREVEGDGEGEGEEEKNGEGWRTICRGWVARRRWKWESVSMTEQSFTSVDGVMGSLNENLRDDQQA
jgi:hypothetical protein